jgi:hypothetical protein
LPSEHPKVTAYVPQPILDALDGWKSENNIESRSAAIVAILVDYLGVLYPVQPEGTAPTVPSGVLSTVLAELAKLSERVATLEQQMAVSAVHQEVPRTASIPEPSSTAPIEAPGIVLEEDATTVSAVQSKALSSAPLEEGTTTSEVLGKAASTVPTSAALQPPAPLTQMALAKRLGCSDKAIEKHRKQGSKENFAEWSRDRDPDGVSWTWEGRGGRGKALRFVPLN